jgi:hypothetical protein
MKIVRDESIEEWALEEAQTNWGKEAREGIHLTDLLTPKLAFFRKTKPQYPTKKELLYWTAGRGHEQAFLDSIGYQHGETKEWNGILYTPDVFLNFPIEFKTRRRMLAKEGNEAETYDWYINQLRGYCAMEDKTQGWLGVLCLVQPMKEDVFKTEPELAFYRVNFDVEELANERNRLSEIKRFFNLALQTNDHSALPDCPKWMCYQESNNIIAKAKCLTCDKVYTQTWRLPKHLNSPKGKGHNYTEAVIEKIQNPKCKYFNDCMPVERRIEV